MNDILTIPKDRALTDVDYAPGQQQGHEFGQVPGVGHWADKAAQLDPLILPRRVMLPIAPVSTKLYRARRKLMSMPTSSRS